MDKALTKKFGEGAFITGDQLQESQHGIVHVSPKIDAMIGGGIPGGSVMTLAGPPKAGKTLTALQTLASAQATGRPTFFLNVEGRIKPRDIKGISGLDVSKLNIIRSYKEEDEDGKVSSRILTAEEFLFTAEYLIHNNPGAVIVIDSISQLVTSGELDKDMGEASRAPGAVLMAQFCKKVSNVVPVNDIILIGILHMIANTSGYGKQFVASGGNKIKYAMDIGMETTKFTFRRKDGKDDGPIIGQSVEWTTTSAALAPPGQKCTSIIEYGIGIDKVAEIVEMAVEYGFIEKGGAWYTLSFLDEPQKVQGINNVINMIREDEKMYETLKNSIYSLLYGDEYESPKENEVG